jgi:nitrate reductase gamma subunit
MNKTSVEEYVRSGNTAPAYGRYLSIGSMKALYALIPVALLIFVVYAVLEWWGGLYFFAVVVPYIAMAIFLIGFIYRIVKWAMSPVPFHIPAVAGQQKSLPWIKYSRLESPSSTAGVIGRMVLEVLLFRSLFRNSRAELKRVGKLIYGEKKYLWLGGLAFHWSLFIILFRHLRLLTEPVPSLILFVQNLDGVFQLWVPTLFISDFIILIALTYLILRRFTSPQVRYISLMTDYFAIFLIASVVISGLLMKVFFRTDVIAVKDLAKSVLAFQPSIPEGISIAFYVHLFLVSALLAYFPFSKLMHGAGVLLSPTRNLLNNSRRMRHVNPWNYAVKTHTYEEWEDEFRQQMKKVGLPVEKE